jgi:hypothetical protein
MRHLFSIAAVAVTLLFAPTHSSAGPLIPGTLFFQVGDGVAFGLEPFQFSNDAEGADYQVADSIFVFFDSVQVTLISGPLLDLDVDAVNGLTTYSYGAGTLTLDISASRDGGATAAGQAILPTLPFSFTVCEGCDSLSGGGRADDFEIQLGHGLIDPDLAALLRIAPEIGFGRIDFGLEDIDGDPGSTLRTGFDHRGAFPLQIDVVEVPEPASAWLVLTAGAAWLARRRTRKR